MHGVLAEAQAAAGRRRRSNIGRARRGVNASRCGAAGGRRGAPRRASSRAGAQGAGQQGHLQRPDSTRPGQELARVRAEEARCAAQALGAQPPIFLGFPDGKLGDYVGDRSLAYRLTQRMAEELGRLRPDIPQAKYFTVRVSFTPDDLAASQRSMVCHKSQFKPEAIERVFPVQASAWKGVIALVPAFATAPGTDLFP